MTRDEAKKLLPIIQAYADGKRIEFRDVDDESWREIYAATFNYSPERYRIKTEPVECWAVFPNGESHPVAWSSSRQGAEDAARYRTNCRAIRMVEA